MSLSEYIDCKERLARAVKALRDVADTCMWNAEAPGTHEERSRWGRVAAFAAEAADKNRWDTDQ